MVFDSLTPSDWEKIEAQYPGVLQAIRDRQNHNDRVMLEFLKREVPLTEEEKIRLKWLVNINA